ncbi:hypothetical protein [Haladaptatus halobius]|uniref:hypothetical protein n=1 Tax=Haladaptatus halobius TaxID=2884875 RepID=UPI001D0BB542|nr:hypothetical protein [Haladaptatus halobius]
MSDFLRPIVENFDPIDSLPGDEEMEAELPENPSVEDISEARSSLTNDQTPGAALFTDKILAELLHLSDQARDRIEEVDNAPVVEWDGEQKDDIHLFFAFIGQAQEYLLRQAVIRKVISDDATTDAMKEKILSDKRGQPMSTGQCLDYLHRGGFIDDGLKGEIGQTRNQRNEAVHDIRRWIFANFDPIDLQSDIARGERTVVRLLELVYGFDLE